MSICHRSVGLPERNSIENELLASENVSLLTDDEGISSFYPDRSKNFIEIYSRRSHLTKSKSMDNKVTNLFFKNAENTSKLLTVCNCLSNNLPKYKKNKKTSTLDSPTEYQSFVDELMPELINPAPMKSSIWSQENFCLRNSLSSEPDVYKSINHQPPEVPLRRREHLTPNSRSYNRKLSEISNDHVRKFCEKIKSEIRIQPVIYNGVKISDTHYWLMNGTHKFLQSKPLRNHQNNTSCESDEIVLTTSALTTSKPPERLGLFYDEKPYVNNIKEITFRPSQDDHDSSIDDDPRLSNTNSLMADKICHQYLQNKQKTLVMQLNCCVPQATEDECHVVLIGSNWDFKEAERRLKVELLSRKVVDSISYFKRVLKSFNWDLMEAMDFVEKDQINRSGNERIRNINQKYFKGQI